VNQVRRLAPLADVVHVEHLRGADYGLAIGEDAGATPVIWDSVDCITHLFEQAVRNRTDHLGRLINRVEVERTRRFEGSLLPRFDRVLVSSRVDREALLDLASPVDRANAAVNVLSNGVDLDYFAPGEEQRHANTLVFSGKMSYHANESAVLHLLREIMPRIWAVRPDTRLVVVGKDPSRQLRRLLAEESARVQVTGTVADIRPYLRTATVAVVPLVYGAGCQNKVLEAMGCGTPVVATPQAVSALNTKPGQDVLVAAAATAFADAVLTLLANPEQCRAIGAAGRRYVEEHHRWLDVAGRLESIYEDALGDRRSATSLRRDLLTA
jgi:glycosyltransferase involved in cell wall biosynthesis